MKRILTTVALTTVMTCGFAASAQAWVQDGSCRLHAYVPVGIGGGQAQASGAIDTCGGWGLATMREQTCAQVWGGSSWITKQDTCADSGTYHSVTGISMPSKPWYYASGRAYRTWTAGQVNGGAWITYESDLLLRT